MNVKKNSIEKLISYNIKNGIKGFYVGGNTGECTVLPNKTRKQMLETVKENTNKFEIIVHVGAGHFEDTLDLLEHANEVGVDAISSLPPALTSFYTANEIIDYYKILAKKSKAPVLAYVTPVLNCDIIWFVTEIMKIENIIGIKLTIPNYFLFEKVKNINDGNLNVLNGPDECMISGLSMGADGAIGTSYNLMPKTSCNIYDNFIKGDIKKAQECQKELNRVIEPLIAYSRGSCSLAKWKVPLISLGIDIGYTAAPARMPSSDEAKEIMDILMKTKFAEEIK